MTDRLYRLIPKIDDEFVRSFLAAADSKESAAGHFVLPALETLAEKWMALEERVKKAEGEK